MSFLDLILAALLVYGFYMGTQKGLFVEVASLVSLIVGIYLAIKFSELSSEILSNYVSWNPKNIQIAAFLITFLLAIIALIMFAKLLTGIADFAHLGWINKLGGGLFKMLKVVLIISVFLNLFEKINYNNYFAKKETLDQSIFFRPIQKTAGFLFPVIGKWYDEVKSKA